MANCPEKSSVEERDTAYQFADLASDRRRNFSAIENLTAEVPRREDRGTNCEFGRRLLSPNESRDRITLTSGSVDVFRPGSTHSFRNTSLIATPGRSGRTRSAALQIFSTPYILEAGCHFSCRPLK
jgi:hypothetical protein